jgi:parvulin-like peptidyl-prolyl isomerase
VTAGRSFISRTMTLLAAGSLVICADARQMPTQEHGVVVRVGDTAISAGDIEGELARRKQSTNMHGAGAGGASWTSVTRDLVRLELFAREALARGYARHDWSVLAALGDELLNAELALEPPVQVRELREFYEAERQRRYRGEQTPYYDRERVSVLVLAAATRTEAERLARRLEDPHAAESQTVLELAHEFGPMSRGGVRGPIAADDTTLPNEVVRAAFALASRGDVASPISVGQNVYVVQLLGREPEVAFEGVEAALRAELSARRRERIRNRIVRERLSEVAVERSANVAALTGLESPGTLLARVGDSTITAESFKRFRRVHEPPGGLAVESRERGSEERARIWLDQAIATIALAQVAERRGYLASRAVKEKLAGAIRVAEAESVEVHAVSDDEVARAFEHDRAEFLAGRTAKVYRGAEAHVSFARTTDRAAALELKARLERATSRSGLDGILRRYNGGRVTVSAGIGERTLPPEVARQVLTRSETGRWSEPIAASDGFYLTLVRKFAPETTLKEASAALRRLLLPVHERRAVERLLSRLRAKTPIVYAERS